MYTLNKLKRRYVWEVLQGQYLFSSDHPVLYPYLIDIDEVFVLKIGTILKAIVIFKTSPFLLLL